MGIEIFSKQSIRAHKQSDLKNQQLPQMQYQKSKSPKSKENKKIACHRFQLEQINKPTSIT